MKRIILLLSVFASLSMAQKFEYLLYSTFSKHENKVWIECALINENGFKVSYECDEDSAIAHSKMLKKHIQMDRKKFPKIYKMDVFAHFGSKGWELVSITGKPDSSNQKYYFKREK